ncbi:MAG: hypothetical protein ACXVB9_12310 [Bdellovibrionota bacterium]
MKFLIPLFLFPILAQSEGLTIIRGGTVENGGNTAYCFRTDMGDAPPQGPGINPPPGVFGQDYYVLDYAHAMQSGYSKRDFANIRDWTDSRQRMENILREVSPRLLSTYQAFADSTDQLLPGGISRSLHRSWVETHTYQVIEDRPGFAPPSCLGVLQYSIAPEVQNAILTFRGYLRTVTRKQRGHKVEYVYNGSMLKYLETRSPLQYSILLTHEWLWDHTKKLDVNQRANIFLHSEAVETMTGRQIRAHLRELGLKF